MIGNRVDSLSDASSELPVTREPRRSPWPYLLLGLLIGFLAQLQMWASNLFGSGPIGRALLGWAYAQSWALALLVSPLMDPSVNRVAFSAIWMLAYAAVALLLWLLTAGRDADAKGWPWGRAAKVWLAVQAAYSVLLLG